METNYKQREKEFLELASSYRESYAYRQAQLCEEQMNDDEYLAQFDGGRNLDAAEEHIDVNYLKDSLIKCAGLRTILGRFKDKKEWSTRGLSELLKVANAEIELRRKERQAAQRVLESPKMQNAIEEVDAIPEGELAVATRERPQEQQRQERNKQVKMKGASRNLCEKGREFLQAVRKAGVEFDHPEVLAVLKSVFSETGKILERNK